MDRKKFRRLITVSLIILLLGNLEKVQSANNLKIDGNQVYGEPFTLACSTSTTNTLNFALFYRSTNSEQHGKPVGYREFYPGLTTSCRERTISTNYTVSCNSDGSMFTLTIPANNTIEHNTYWRCRTYTDTSVFDNTVIDISIIVRITGISMVSPVVGPDNTVNVTSDKPTTFQCQTTQGRPAANITWYLDNAQLYGGTRTTTSVSGDIVITTGSLTLTAENRTADYKVLSCRATNYVNMEPVESKLKPVIRVNCPPDPPRQLRTTVTYSSITLFWLAGFYGGADQTFTVEYRTTTETMFKVAAVITGGHIEGVQFNTAIQDLSPDTHYVIHITCSNIFGQQKEIRFIEARTAPDKPSVSTSSILPVVGGTIGGLLGVVLVGLIVYLLKRRVLDTSSNTTMRNTAANGNRAYDTLQITSPEASTYQTLELNDSSSSGVYVNLEL